MSTEKNAGEKVLIRVRRSDSLHGEIKIILDDKNTGVLRSNDKSALIEIESGNHSLYLSLHHDWAFDGSFTGNRNGYDEKSSTIREDFKGGRLYEFECGSYGKWLNSQFDIRLVEVIAF